MFIITNIIWLILCIMVGVYANNKGRSGIGYFFLSFFFSPIVGLIVILLRAENTKFIENKQIQTGQMRRCPFCAEIIKTKATKCKHCNSTL